MMYNREMKEGTRNIKAIKLSKEGLLQRWKRWSEGDWNGNIDNKNKNKKGRGDVTEKHLYSTKKTHMCAYIWLKRQVGGRRDSA